MSVKREGNRYSDAVLCCDNVECDNTKRTEFWTFYDALDRMHKYGWDYNKGKRSGPHYCPECKKTFITETRWKKI